VQTQTRKASDEADADVDVTDVMKRVVDAMDALRQRRGVMLEDGGVGVPVGRTEAAVSERA
jgi:hypothetical protein